LEYNYLRKGSPWNLVLKKGRNDQSKVTRLPAYFGSAQEFVKSGILRGLRDFVKCDVFGVGDGHALRFQE
jgi:hypothetical protein